MLPRSASFPSHLWKAEELRGVERGRGRAEKENWLSPSVLEWLPLDLEGEADSLALNLALAAAFGCWPAGE